MKFNKVLKEYNESVPLHRWNEIQKGLWMRLVEKELVSKNDVKKFFEFAKFFDQFFSIKRRYPTTVEIIKKLRLR